MVVPDYDSQTMGADECLHGGDGGLEVFFLKVDDGSDGGLLCQVRDDQSPASGGGLEALFSVRRGWIWWRLPR
jgi:hypothetical protein